MVDDDDRLRALLKRYLSEQGFIVSVAGDTMAASSLRRYFLFDLIVLDVMMPGQTGTEWLRAERVDTPVLMLSALGEADNRIEGLEVGAEDYLSKPFEPKELVLRIRAILRRTGEQRDRGQLIRFGDYSFDMGSGQLKRADAPVHLTGSEAELLRALARHAGQPVSRETLAQMTPGTSNERSIDVQLSRLRKKLENGDHAPAIQTVRGAGYVLYVD